MVGGIRTPALRIRSIILEKSDDRGYWVRLITTIQYFGPTIDLWKTGE